ncbi:MAG: hypothetical protein JWR43_1559 [Phenylobacterium sp.]|nr:hypothetical protein [Phenylobacterium sp.]
MAKPGADAASGPAGGRADDSGKNAGAQPA